MHKATMYSCMHSNNSKIDNIFSQIKNKKLKGLAQYNSLFCKGTCVNALYYDYRLAVTKVYWKRHWGFLFSPVDLWL